MSGIIQVMDDRGRSTQNVGLRPAEFHTADRADLRHPTRWKLINILKFSDTVTHLKFI